MASQAGYFNIQEFSDAGTLLIAGRVYTYAAGTTTFKTAYTDLAGVVPQTYTADGLGGFYIALNTRGEIPAPLYLTAGSYDITLKRADGSTVWTRQADPGSDVAAALAADLANNTNASKGSAQVGYLPAGTGAVGTNLQAKLREIVSARDYGAIQDGVTDDTAAVTNARNSVSLAGGSVLFNGKAAGGSDTRALAREYILGSSATPALNQSARFPLVHTAIYNATPQLSAGYAHYGHRVDYQTKSGVDVQSSVAFAAIVQSYSTNSGGTPNENNTNQVAAVFNSSAMDANSSAGVTALNVIGESAYTGAIPHAVNPFQINIACHRVSGWYGEANKTYSATSTIINVGSFDATFAIGIDTSVAGVGFLHGMVISGVKNSGITIARNTITPDTGIWVSAATTYGMYIGAKNLYQLNAGQIPTYDSLHNPSIGLCLGERAATSGASNKLRFSSTNSSSIAHNVDINVDSTNTVVISFDGAGNVAIAPNGALLIQGNQVLATRQTVTGSRSSGAALVSLLAALAAHGMIIDSTTS